MSIALTSTTGFDEVNSNVVVQLQQRVHAERPAEPTPARSSGNGFATFLLGLPTSGNVVTGTPRTEQYRYYAFYLQDDWKIGSRLTVNVGVRWDYQPAVTVKDNLTVSGFDFNVDESAAVAVAAGRRDDQSRNEPAAPAEWRPAVCEPWRPGVAV